MKIAIYIPGILGVITSGAYGSVLLETVEGFAPHQRAHLSGMVSAGYLHFAVAIAGIAGLFMAWKGQLALAGGLMLGAGVIGFLFAAMSVPVPEVVMMGLFFDAPLVVGGIVALFAHAKARRVAT